MVTVKLRAAAELLEEAGSFVPDDAGTLFVCLFVVVVVVGGG
jgi:hypothetical protein